MQEQARSLEELFGRLLPENLNELRPYLEFLIAKQEARTRRSSTGRGPPPTCASSILPSNCSTRSPTGELRPNEAAD